MPPVKRFKERFTATELIAKDLARPDEVALLLLSPSTFAVLGWLAEIVSWSDFIVDDVSVGTDYVPYWDVIEGIKSEMGYTYGLTEYLERMADAQERIAANLEANDGEGGISGIGQVIFDLLPVLLAGSVPSQELASWFTSGGFEIATASSAGGGGCCEPNPTNNGLVSLPTGGTCFSLRDLPEPQNEYGTVLTPILNGFRMSNYDLPELDVTFTIPPAMLTVDGHSGVLTIEPSTEGLYLDYTISQGGNTLYSGGGVGTQNVNVEFSLDGSDPVTINFRSGGNTDQLRGFEVYGEFCTGLDLTKPMVVVSLNDGIGKIESGGLLKSAGAWTIGAFNSPTIKVSGTVPSTPDMVQIDYTRPINGTVSIQTYYQDTLVDNTMYDMSDKASIVIDNLSERWDTIKAQIIPFAEQRIRDFLIWAIFNN